MSTSSSLWQRSLADFQHAVETRSTPGCGAAATLNGCLGLSLVLKGVRLHRGEQQADRRQRLVAEGDALQRSLAEAVDDDAEAFARYLEVLQLPDGNDAESRRRESALSEARNASIEIPLTAAEQCRAGLSLAVEALSLTSPAMRSDTLAGATLLKAALDALLIGVEANLESLPDQGPRRELEVRCTELRDRARSHCQRLGIGA